MLTLSFFTPELPRNPEVGPPMTASAFLGTNHFVHNQDVPFEKTRERLIRMALVLFRPLSGQIGSHVTACPRAIPKVDRFRRAVENRSNRERNTKRDCPLV